MEHIKFDFNIYSDQLTITQSYIDLVESIELELVNQKYTSYYKIKNNVFINGTQEIIKPSVEKIAKLKNFSNLIFENCWVQKYKQGQYHPLHTHGVEGFSFVFYINVTDNSSKTCFYNPGYPYVQTHEYIVKPKRGLIIIFDKAIPHFVEPNKDEERLIVSGNFILS